MRSPPAGARTPLSLLAAVPLVMADLMAAPAAGAEGMAFPGKRWEELSPESQGVDGRVLAAAVEELKGRGGQDGVRELVIVRDGRLIWKGEDIDRVHGVWSCTKSFTSTVLGLLIDDGKCALDSRAAEAAPELTPAYPAVTLRHFTTMTSGYRAAGDEPKGGYKHGPSGTPFTPSPQPLFTPPGSRYAYWDSAMNMFGLVLTRIAGEPLEALFRRRVADPIGMDPRSWDWGDHSTDGGVVVNGGSGNGDKHVFISARELARFGHLFLNQGLWNGRQLIGRDWVRQATSVQVEGSKPWAHPESKIDGRGSYGFNWWRNGEGADGRRKWPDAPAGTFAAMGHNNNVCFVVPEWRMVIVRLGLDEADHKITDEEWSGFLRHVGRSLHDAGRPASPRATPAAGPLRVHPANPRYFTDGAKQPDGSLKAILLTGSHTWNNLVDMDRADPPAPFDFDAYLDFLERHGHNFIRLWTWDTVTWDTRANGGLGKDFVHQVAPLPWARTGPGAALDGKPRFDLTKLDPAYLERLRARAGAAGRRGIYVSVMLFEGWSLFHANRGRAAPEGWAWRGHPFHPENNINGLAAGAGRGGARAAVHSLAEPRINALQEAYVRKVVDTLADLGNVLYEVINEGGEKDWDWWVVKLVLDHEKSGPRRHPVGLTGHGAERLPSLLESPADWVSPGRADGYGEDPASWDGKKVSLLDTDHVWGVGGNPAWVWKGFLRGHNPIFMDPYDGRVLGTGTERWDPVRRAMGQARRIADRVALAALRPRDDLASTRYCLADPGREYLVYLPEGGEATVDLEAAPGTFTVEWLDPRAGTAVQGGAVQGGSRRSLASPLQGDALVHLKR